MLPVLAVVLASLSQPPVAAPPEVQWARGIVDEFWSAALVLDRSQADAAFGLMTPVLAGALKERFDVPGGGYCDNTLRWFAHRYGRAITTISSTDLSPDRAEVVFKGRLAGFEFGDRDMKTEAEFTIRVAKQPGGAWAIRFLRVTDRTK